MRTGDTIEDVLFTSVGKEVTFCFLCSDKETARQIQTCVITGECVLHWNTEDCSFGGVMKLASREQVRYYARDFRSLCERIGAGVHFMRFTVGDQSQQFSVEDLLTVR